jgi:hypothetical protein
MLVLYCIFACTTVIIGVVVFLILRKRSLLVAFLSTLVAMTLTGFFFPIPIHGGFTIVLEELIGNYQNDKKLLEHIDEIEIQ